MNDLECFIVQNGIKKKWLADKLEVSPELLRHHMKKDEFPEDLRKKALDALSQLESSIFDYLFDQEGAKIILGKKKKKQKKSCELK